LRLGGGVIPDGDFWALITPEPLRHKYHLAPRFEKVCFERSLALRTRGSEIGGLGHPLVNALTEEVLKPEFRGSVAMDGGDEAVCAHYLVTYPDQKGHRHGKVLSFRHETKTRKVNVLKRFPSFAHGGQTGGTCTQSEVRESIESSLQETVIEWLPDRHARAGLRASLVGLHCM
jgi:hypothetical protein